MKSLRASGCALAWLVLVVSPAHAETTAEFLRAFHANPARVMERLPSEVDARGNAIPRGYIDQALVDRTFKDRKAVRARIMKLRRPDSAVIGGGQPDSKDLPEKLIEPGNVVRSITEMDTRRLTRAALPVTPWADSYWPMYKGLIAVRYADKSFPNSKSWSVNYGYVTSNPAAMIVAAGNPAAIDTLSPAEKYDFAVGDLGFSLTRYAWAQGEKYMRENGAVAGWMGICHGWSGAAQMPAAITEAPVRVIAANGTPVTFYPQDVKALQSMLWANAAVPTRFVGNRCDVSRPTKNAYGRILDPGCFDTNPGTWHIGIVNQLGIHQRSFVLDSTYDAQVWNFALAGYKYRYFNPQFLQETPVLDDALIPIERFTMDKFREFRSPDARYVVGIVMDATHVNAIGPTRANKVEPPLKTERFIYDLELDANYNIVGGEWYSNGHPDFMWTFDKNAQALGFGETPILNDAWAPGSPVPAGWAPVARGASGRGTPLFSFIRRLVTPGPPPPDGEASPPEHSAAAAR